MVWRSRSIVKNLVEPSPGVSAATLAVWNSPDIDVPLVDGRTSEGHRGNRLILIRVERFEHRKEAIKWPMQTMVLLQSTMTVVLQIPFALGGEC